MLSENICFVIPSLVWAMIVYIAPKHNNKGYMYIYYIYCISGVAKSSIPSNKRYMSGPYFLVVLRFRCLRIEFTECYSLSIHCNYNVFKEVIFNEKKIRKQFLAGKCIQFHKICLYPQEQITYFSFLFI